MDDEHTTASNTDKNRYRRTSSEGRIQNWPSCRASAAPRFGRTLQRLTPEQGSIRADTGRAPKGQRDADFSLRKNFQLSERFRLQLRSDFQDLLNHSDL